MIAAAQGLAFDSSRFPPAYSDAVSREGTIVLAHLLMGVAMIATGLFPAFVPQLLVPDAWGISRNFSSGADVGAHHRRAEAARAHRSRPDPRNGLAIAWYDPRSPGSRRARPGSSAGNPQSWLPVRPAVSRPQVRPASCRKGLPEDRGGPLECTARARRRWTAGPQPDDPPSDEPPPFGRTARATRPDASTRGIRPRAVSVRQHRDRLVHRPQPRRVIGRGGSAPGRGAPHRHEGGARRAMVLGCVAGVLGLAAFNSLRASSWPWSRCFSRPASPRRWSGP